MGRVTAIRSHHPQTKELTRLSSEVIRVLIYFDLFQYPLKLHEILEHLGIKANEVDLEEELKGLVHQGLIRKENGYFSVGEDLPAKISRRKEGNIRAQRAYGKAIRYGKFIARFPFVRGVYVSGSMSKGYLAPEGDIDYFVVTTEGRLWLSKGLMILFKKIFLLNSRKYFCLNYFLDTSHLDLPDENLFTARELYTLIPLVNGELYTQMVDENPWARTHMPNYEVHEGSSSLPLRMGLSKRGIEFVLRNRVGDWIDVAVMRGFESFWRRKYKAVTRVNQDVSIRCYRHTSKIHPGNFQEKVLSSLEARLRSFEQEYDVKLLL